MRIPFTDDEYGIDSSDPAWAVIALRLDQLNHAPGVPTGDESVTERWEIHKQIDRLVGTCVWGICKESDRGQPPPCTA